MNLFGRSPTGRRRVDRWGQVGQVYWWVLLPVHEEPRFELRIAVPFPVRHNGRWTIWGRGLIFDIRWLPRLRAVPDEEHEQAS